MKILFIIVLAMIHGATISIVLGEYTDFDAFEKSIISGVNWTIIYSLYIIFKYKREQFIENKKIKVIEKEKLKKIREKENKKIRDQTFINIQKKEQDEIDNEQPITNQKSMFNLNMEKIE